MNEPLFDFSRPIPPTCKDCGYPFGEGFDGVKRYRIRPVDCPEHMPAWWKYHEAQAYQEATRDR